MYDEVSLMNAHLVLLLPCALVVAFFFILLLRFDEIVLCVPSLSETDGSGAARFFSFWSHPPPKRIGSSAFFVFAT